MFSSLCSGWSLFSHSLSFYHSSLSLSRSPWTLSAGPFVWHWSEILYASSLQVETFIINPLLPFVSLLSFSVTLRHLYPSAHPFIPNWADLTCLAETGRAEVRLLWLFQINILLTLLFWNQCGPADQFRNFNGLVDDWWWWWWFFLISHTCGVILGL